MADYLDKRIEFLHPENLKGDLISCALYIATFESFKDYVIEEIKFFFYSRFNETGDHLSSLMALRIKIEKWWTLNMEIPPVPLILLMIS